MLPTVKRFESSKIEVYHKSKSFMEEERNFTGDIEDALKKLELWT